jgi:hypothetical protein
MASTATAVDFAALDQRTTTMGALDAELAAAYQQLIEGLDFAGELDTRRAQVIVEGLDAMLVVLCAT